MGMGRMGMGQMGMASRGQSATIPATGGQTTVANEVQRKPADTDSTEMGEEDGTVKGLADALVLLTKRMFVKPTMPTKPSEETKTTEPPKEPKEPREPMQPMEPRGDREPRHTVPPKKTTEPHKEPKEPLKPMQPMKPRHDSHDWQPRQDSHDEDHFGRDGYPQDLAHADMRSVRRAVIHATVIPRSGRVRVSFG